MTARRAWFALAVVVHLVALYAPTAPAEPSAVPIDKVVHAAIFFAVVWTGARAGLPLRWLAAVLAAHAAGSELAQHYLLVHRDGSVGDAVADLAGVVLAVAVVVLTRRRGADRPATGAEAPDPADAGTPSR